ncbi:MAG: putative quinol monooxygenase [Panacagrimonas sp.]
MNTAVRVIARLPAKADKIEELKVILLSIIEPTRKEAGCLSYELLQNSADSSDFTFVETWDSAAALDAHMKSPHLTAALGKLGDLLGGAPEIRRYTTLR